MTGLPQRFTFGIVGCSTHTISQLLEELRGLLSDRTAQPRIILGLNAHVYCLAASNSELRAILDRSRITAADGMSIVWAAHLFGNRIPERCNMTEAFRAFLAAPDMPPTTAVLLGASQEEADSAARCMQEASGHCRVVRAVSGFLESDQYANILKEHMNVDLVLIGMGTPKSERVAALAARVNPRAVIWHIGGGTVRFLAGTVKEAPALLRRTGLQWLHRLCAEPRRMWKRYTVGNWYFAWLVLAHRVRKKIPQ